MAEDKKLDSQQRINEVAPKPTESFLRKAGGSLAEPDLSGVFPLRSSVFPISPNPGGQGGAGNTASTTSDTSAQGGAGNTASTTSDTSSQGQQGS